MPTNPLDALDIAFPDRDGDLAIDLENYDQFTWRIREIPTPIRWRTFGIDSYLREQFRERNGIETDTNIPMEEIVVD